MRMNNKGEKSVLADKIHELNKQVLAKEEELAVLKRPAHIFRNLKHKDFSSSKTIAPNFR